jgi:hypothetical protein
MTPNLQTAFTYSPAMPHQPGVTRRDPSAILKLGWSYYAWYTRSDADTTGHGGTIYYATSTNGEQWNERRQVVWAGEDGEWDSYGVFAPDILVVGRRYFLFYTGAAKPFTDDGGGPNGTPTAIGLAVADRPDGPWTKVESNPILQPGAGDAPDSHRVENVGAILRRGEVLLYYRARRRGRSAAEAEVYLARALNPLGPFVRAEGGPVVPGAPEVCVWPHGDGVAAMVGPGGPEANTIHYSPDGVHFTRQAAAAVPRSPGPCREDLAAGYTGRGTGFTWGLCHDEQAADRPFLQRFDCDLRLDRK